MLKKMKATLIDVGSHHGKKKEAKEIKGKQEGERRKKK